MNEKEIRAMFQPKVCNSQVEFDDFMHSLNNAQSIANHPYLDRLREINKQRELIQIQIEGLKQQQKALKVEAIDIEQKQKDINRVFHAIKHELIELNPIGLKNESKQL